MLKHFDHMTVAVTDLAAARLANMYGREKRLS